MYIYLDIIWLLNFCFDALLLWLTAYILKRKTVWWRIALGALIGSSLVLLMVSPLSYYAAQPIVKLGFSVFIVGAAFGFKRFRYFMQGLLMFYFSTFMVGGGMIAVHYLIQSEGSGVNMAKVYSHSASFGHPISWFFVLAGFPLLLYFSKQRLAHIEVKKVQYEEIVDVTIAIHDLALNLKGLIDSGNQLYDPMTGAPVMIIDMTKKGHLFPEEIAAQSKNLNAFSFSLEGGLEGWEERIRLIPYRGVGQDHQFLLALKPDKILIQTKTELLNVKKGLIALNHTPLSADGEFDCIVHPKMIIGSAVQSAS